MAPVDTKGILRSRTVLGNSASLVSLVVAFIVAKTHLPPDAVEPFITAVVTAGVGNLVSIFGRLVAGTKLEGWF